MNRHWPSSSEWGGRAQSELVMGYRYFMIGVVSYGSAKCGSSKAGVYTKISHRSIRNWIIKTSVSGNCKPSACHVYNNKIGNESCQVNGYWDPIKFS